MTDAPTLPAMLLRCSGCKDFSKAKQKSQALWTSDRVVPKDARNSLATHLKSSKITGMKMNRKQRQELFFPGEADQVPSHVTLSMARLCLQYEINGRCSGRSTDSMKQRL